MIVWIKVVVLCFDGVAVMPPGRPQPAVIFEEAKMIVKSGLPRGVA